MSKGFPETIGGRFGGIYGGGASTEGTKRGFEESDLVVIIGHYPVCQYVLPAVGKVH